MDVSDGDDGSIVWIAGYPRSGNTFVRLLLANYLVGRFEPINLNGLKDLSFGEHIERLWLKVTKAPLAARDEKTQWLARDAYFNVLRATTPQTARRFVKSHTVNSTRWDAPAFNFRPADRIIYVARDPRDVAVSLAGFHGWEPDRAISHMLEPFATLCGHPASGYETTGSWKLNVRSWLHIKECPLLVVPFSDLRADSESWLTVRRQRL